MAGLLYFQMEMRLAANRYALDRLLAVHNYFYEVVAIGYHAAVGKSVGCNQVNEVPRIQAHVAAS